MDRRLTPATTRVAHISLQGQIDAPAFTAGKIWQIAAPLVDLLRSPHGPRERQLWLGEDFTVIDRDQGHAFGFASKDGYCGWLPEAVLTANGAKAIGRAFSDMAVDKSRFSEADLDHYRQNALKPGAATAMVNWYRAGARNGMIGMAIAVGVTLLTLFSQGVLDAITLGLIGAGNIGSIVASRALGLRMKVVAFDPFLTAERAIEMGVEKADLDTLLAKADFITLHTPLTDQTRNILSKENLAKTKKGVRIINCARGGLVDEAALKEALDSGQVGGAALDVFATEPAKESPLFGTPNFICTPHLGASTNEAQVNVALQVAEQMADYLVNGGVTNALNMPSLSAEEAPKLKPYMTLAQKLGSLVGQLAHDNLDNIAIEVEGAAAELNIKPITAAVLSGFMRRFSDAVNMVNAPFLAKERGFDIREVRHDKAGAYHTLVRVTVNTAQGPRSVAGTLFANSEARLVEIFGISLEAELEGSMLYIVNEDAPGFIGRVGTALGEAGLNIGTFHLGRRSAGGEAVLLLSMDAAIPEAVLKQLASLPGVKTVKALKF